MTLTYPPSRRSDQVDDYHGTPVPDPYRWLEDTDSPETAAWVQAQNALTFSFLERIPARQRLRQRLSELWDYPRQSPFVSRGGRYFQLRNTGLQNQNVLFTFDSWHAEPRLLLDPNTLSSDGTVALSTWQVSLDGSLLAYATSASGSDWLTWHVRRVDSGEDLPDIVEWSKFSGAAWLPDNSGFYYSRYAAPASQAYTSLNQDQQLYFHCLGQSQAQDPLVYSRPDHPDWGFNASVTDDGHYLALSVWAGTDVRNRFFYQDLNSCEPVVELIPELEASYEFIDNTGPVFFFLTDLHAPRGRVIAIDVTHPAQEGWRTVIPESADTLESVSLVNDQFICQYLHNAYHQLLRFSLQGEQLGSFDLPTIGTVYGIGMGRVSGSRQDKELFYGFESFAYPPSIFRYDFERDESDLLYESLINFDFSPYVTRQVFVPSQDGTRVPLFLIHRQGLVMEGKHPTLLFGYGGFKISLTPAFSISRLAWLELGGVLAVANLRGGGEFGEEWHKAGSLANKQNVFDDFIACAEYLVSSQVTSPARLAIQGGSNGGLLVGACMTQRPDLFGAALPAVGVMDMLRFHKFTIGWAWVSDYGSADDPQQFQTLLAYSPLHNLKPGVHYPATLVTTADHDDRVVPGHSFKFAAALQAAQQGDVPVLIRIQTKAGHGAGKPTAIIIQEQADIWAFLVKVFEINYPQGETHEHV